MWKISPSLGEDLFSSGDALILNLLLYMARASLTVTLTDSSCLIYQAQLSLSLPFSPCQIKDFVGYELPPARGGRTYISLSLDGRMMYI